MNLQIIIEKDAEGYHARVPVLPGCGTWGETVQEAMKILKRQ